MGRIQAFASTVALAVAAQAMDMQLPTEEAAAVVPSQSIDSSTFIGDKTTVETFRRVSTKVAAFEGQLGQQDAEYRAQLKQEKERYDKELETSKHKVMKMQMENGDLKKQVEDAQQTNYELVQKIKDLQHDTELWHDDWVTLHGNLSDAVELTTMTLNSFANESVPELKVMRDLERMETDREDMELRQLRVDEIMQMQGADDDLHSQVMARTAWLQTGKRMSRVVPDSEEVLKVLQDGLTSMTAEHEQKKDELKREYQAMFAKLEQRRDGILQERVGLNETLAELIGVQEKLTNAISHLEAVNGHLENRGKAIRSYAQRVGMQGVLAVAKSSGQAMPVPPTMSTNEASEPTTTRSSSSKGALRASAAVSGAADLEPIGGTSEATKRSASAGVKEPTLVASEGIAKAGKQDELADAVAAEADAKANNTAAGSDNQASWLGWLKR